MAKENAENAEKALKTMDAKGMLKAHGAKGTKIKYNDRMCCIIVEATKHYRKGQIIEPHPVMGAQLIADGIAKEYTKPKAKK